MIGVCDCMFSFLMEGMHKCTNTCMDRLGYSNCLKFELSKYAVNVYEHLGITGYEVIPLHTIA